MSVGMLASVKKIKLADIEYDLVGKDELSFSIELEDGTEGSVEDIDYDLLGISDYRKSLIELKRGLKHETMKNTLLHEILHGIFDHYSLNKLINGGDDEIEVIICVLTSALRMTIKNTPELIDIFK